MRPAAVIVTLVVVATTSASCSGGGGNKPLAATARPCLAKLGDYVHHRPEKGLPADPDPRLPLLDPDAPPGASASASRLKWPEDFEEYGEVLYPPSNPGANGVQIFIFADDALPTRVLAGIHRRTGNQTAFIPGFTFNRIGQTIVQWSSLPSAQQRRALRACLIPT